MSGVTTTRTHDLRVHIAPLGIEALKREGDTALTFVRACFDCVAHESNGDDEAR